MNQMRHYDTSNGLLPECPSIGHGVYERASIGGMRPDNKRAYEICYIVKGSVEWWINNTLYELGTGTTFVNYPGEWHGGKNALLHPCEIYWLQFNFPPVGELTGLPSDVIEELAIGYRTMQVQHLTASPMILPCFEQLLNEHHERKMGAQSVARALFHQILIHTWRDYQNKKSIGYSPPISTALQWMSYHISENFLMEDVARVVNLSPAYFNQVFSEEIGVSPAEYHMRQRIRMAKQHLRGENDSITTIAFELGFSTSQYFSTVFKRLTGITPGQYRELMRNRF